MSSVPPDCARVVDSIPDAAWVADFVRRRYDLSAPLACTTLNRGLNDTFALRTEGDEAFVFRLSRHRRRTVEQVSAETAFLAHLDAAGAPIAAPLRTSDGDLVNVVACPEGHRAGVLFHAAAGRRPELDAPDDARAQGASLAIVHDHAERYRAAGPLRALDLDTLLHRPLAAIFGLSTLTQTTRAGLEGLAAHLDDAIRSRAGLLRVHCHGDCHGLNARIDKNGQAILFDFDDGGLGYLAYDLAVHLWAQISFGRRRHAMWHAFIDGYRSIRPIAAGDFEAVRWFVPIRHLWLMGLMAEAVPEWGSDAITQAWLDRETAFLRAWEAGQLAPGLF